MSDKYTFSDKEKILKDLQSLFENDDSVNVSRTENSVTFSQLFTDSMHADAKYIAERYMKRFSHTIKIDGDTYMAIDEIRSGRAGLFGAGFNYFKGEIYQKGFFVSYGRDKKTGEMGAVADAWSTDYIKKPVRAYMETTGLTRKRQFWTGKKIAIIFAAIWIPIIILYIVLFNI